MDELNDDGDNNDSRKSGRIQSSPISSRIDWLSDDISNGLPFVSDNTECELKLRSNLMRFLYQKN